MEKRPVKKVKKLDVKAFEQELKVMAREGILDADLDETLIAENEIEPATLTRDEFQRFYQTAKKASHEKALIEARAKIAAGKDPFGRFLQRIREKSELSKQDVARLLNKDSSYIERIENGQISPLNLLPPAVADIMQLFRLTLSELKTGIKAFLTLSTVKKGKISGMARSSIKAGTKGKEDSLAHAMDATLQAIAEKTGKARQDKIKIAPDYLEAVEEELEKRGEEDLLV